MKKILVIMMLLFVGMLNVHEAKAYTDSIVRGNFEFEYEPTKGGVWITRVNLLSDKGIATLKIPAKIKGKKVVKFGTKELKNAEWQDNGYSENVFGVALAPDDANYIYEPTDVFELTTKIKKIQVPDTVKTITRMSFNYFHDRASINIPKGVTKDVGSFAYNNWKKITISKKNKKFKIVNGCLLSKDGKILYSFLKEKEKMVVPKTVKTMKNISLTHTKISTLVLPKGLCNIEAEGLKVSSKLTIKVAKGNKKYAAKYGCLYNKKTKKLVATCAPDGVLRIPEGITYATSYYIESGIRVDDAGIHEFGGVASKMIVPESMKQIDSILEFSSTEEFTCVMKGKTPPKLTCVIESFVKKLTVYVPKGTKTLYEEKWGKAFKYCDSLTVTYIEQE
nr:leucine-rich repeat protein [Eubacterium sp.]